MTLKTQHSSCIRQVLQQALSSGSHNISKVFFLVHGSISCSLHGHPVNFFLESSVNVIDFFALFLLLFQTLIKRHQEFVMLYNSQCDSEKPMTGNQ